MESRRVSNKKRTEREILSVATRLFSEKGVSATTINDIVSNSSIARGTFYNYFRNTEEIWVDIINQAISDSQSKIHYKQKPGKTFKERLYLGYIASISILNTPPLPALIAKNQARFREMFYKSPVLAEVFKQWEDEVRQGGLLKHKSDDQISMASYILVGSVVELVIQSYLNDKQFTRENMAEFLANIFTDGMFERPNNENL